MTIKAAALVPWRDSGKSSHINEDLFPTTFLTSPEAEASVGSAAGQQQLSSIISYADDVLMLSQSKPKISADDFDNEDSTSCMSDVTYGDENRCCYETSASVPRTIGSAKCHLNKLPPVVVVSSDEFDLLNGKDGASPLSAPSFDSSSTSSIVESASLKSLESAISSKDSSTASLLSSTGSALCESSARSNHSESTDLSALSLKLRKRVQHRTKSLRRISNGNMRYFRYLSKQEEGVRRKTEHALARKRKLSLLKKSANSNNGALEQDSKATPPGLCPVSTSEEDTSEDTNRNLADAMKKPDVDDMQPAKPLVVEKIHRICLFDWYHSLPAFLAMMLWYHAYESMFDTLKEINLKLFPDTLKTDFSQLVLGILLCKMSGGLFHWLNNQTFLGAKFDLQNKLRLGDFDARLIRWMRMYPKFRERIDILGTLLCFVAANNFYDEMELDEKACALYANIMSLEEIPEDGFPICNILVSAVNAAVSFHLLKLLGIEFEL